MFHNEYKEPAIKLVAGFLSYTCSFTFLRILQLPVKQVH
jgi:hypothetical protein